MSVPFLAACAIKAAVIFTDDFCWVSLCLHSSGAGGSFRESPVRRAAPSDLGCRDPLHPSAARSYCTHSGLACDPFQRRHPPLAVGYSKPSNCCDAGASRDIGERHGRSIRQRRCPMGCGDLAGRVGRAHGAASDRTRPIGPDVLAGHSFLRSSVPSGARSPGAPTWREAGTCLAGCAGCMHHALYLGLSAAPHFASSRL